MDLRKEMRICASRMLMKEDIRAFQSASMELLARLEAKKATIQQEYQKRIAAVDTEIEAVATTLRLLRQPGTVNIAVSDSVVLSDSIPMIAIKDKSAREALIEIARRSGGIVRIKAAKELLIGAGILKDTKNTWGAVYTTLSRSRDFAKGTEPGTFRLIERPEQPELLAAS